MSTQKDKSLPDPAAEREAQKYEFPVPSREAVLALLAKRAAPLSFREMADALAVSGARDEDAFGRRLRAMERDGQILRNRRDLYGLPRKMDLVRGRVSGHPDGFGFLIPEEGGEDLFLSPGEMRQVLHGDRALARVRGVDARGRKEGAIIEILERAQRTMVGRFTAAERMGFVVPHDRRVCQDILVPRGDDGGARDGQIVMVEILEQPSRRTGPVGRVIELLGEHMAPGMEIEVAIRAHQIPHVWPEEALREARRFDAEVPEEAARGREDLRALPLVTIDGEDARDFDDAVHAAPHADGWRLIVAIADVGHYVAPGSALDAEAYARGNSVYFPQRVIPMLPEELSNGLCSLNPHVDRLCMACEIHIGRDGEIGRHRFFEAVMRSQARLTYNQVAAMLVHKDAGVRLAHAALIKPLEALYGLYQALHAARKRRGAVDFELPETRIIFDEQRKIKRVVALERNDAHRLIEECMLAANVSAAELLKKRKMIAPYRVHEGPPPEKLKDLREFLGELGLQLGGGNTPEAQHYAKLLAAIGRRPDARLIHSVLLRSLSQALYSPDNIGHFALGFPHYTHFTSPIRRYPDLLVHRAIRNALRGRPGDVSIDLAKQQGEHCSMTERRADEATREVVRWLKAEFMMDRIGEEFDGIITGVTNFGIFVELSEVFVDGLVHVTALGNDYYHFDPVRHRLLGERTRRSYRLGDAVRVRVVRVDLDEAKLDFELAAAPAGGNKRAPRERKGAPAEKRGRGPGRRGGRGRKR
ncbi:MAG: ribonuclease R [Candidatus Muproteobacteria bacterium RBG_16_65_31]|uniref:Ribonuclease R n=1 Tax=Candidatus Muproteobacteria bacterium RBG_16_65_31 TaxID=1817759 RepID=A0A1F6TB18_9PROT|nr:MAG: ribonuclease R [Candidatus Muproteobacteria bacterium RBG_16_65_31]